VNKPADYLLSVFEFFAIVLPGALATWLAAQQIDYHTLLGAPREAATSTFLWIAFGLCAYVLGHFVFNFGSNLDPLYDRWRERKKPAEVDGVFLAARTIHLADYQSLTDGYSTLQWARRYLQIHSASASAEADRLEATQKLFRSLTILSPLFAVYFLFRQADLFATLVCVVVGFQSFYQFCDQRWKYSQCCYASVVICHRSSQKNA
jgi:hypothetical protein